MAFRSIGVYLLTSSALYAQKKTVYHVDKMAKLASESAALTMQAGEELESSIELSEKAAIESEEGFELQSESIELELEAEREFAKAAEEMTLGEEYKEEAELLHGQAARDGAESEIEISKAREDIATSDALITQAEEDRAAAALDEERSVSLFEETSTSEEIATEAEERAAEYEAIVKTKEGQSLKDGESLVKTETGAMEDAEGVAACTAIPFLNLLCEAFGAITETGFQVTAAFEGSKSAVESLSAASARRKEQEQLLIALAKQEEAARFTAEGERYQLLAKEELTKANEEVAEAERLKVDVQKSQLLGESLATQRENDEALAVLDEELAAEYFANSARDGSMAAEEQASSIAAQAEAEELLGSSTGEEFVANRIRFDAESKEAKAEATMKQSIAHEVHAFGFAFQSLMTASLVIYVVIMRFIFREVIPALKRSSETQFTAADFGEKMLLTIMHFAVLIGTIGLVAGRLSFDGIAMKSRWKSFGLLALVAGVIESLAVYSLSELCCFHRCGANAAATASAAATTFISNAVYLVPVSFMESLSLNVMMPSAFTQLGNSTNKQVWIWLGLIFMIIIHISVFKLKKVLSDAKKGQIMEYKYQINYEAAEDYFCGEKRESSTASNTIGFDQEYGTMEEISLLNHTNITEEDSNNVSSRKSTGWYHKFCHYCQRLRLSSDLLILSLMGVLLYHSFPLLKVLGPVSKSFLGLAASSLHIPILLAVCILVLIVHFIFVH